MRALLGLGMLAMTACSGDAGDEILAVYKMPITDVHAVVPPGVLVCWGLQAAHMSGQSEAGLEQDIVDTCGEASRNEELSDNCRDYAKAAVAYGRAALSGEGVAAAAEASDTPFVHCKE